MIVVDATDEATVLDDDALLVFRARLLRDRANVNARATFEGRQDQRLEDWRDLNWGMIDLCDMALAGNDEARRRATTYAVGLAARQSETGNPDAS